MTIPANLFQNVPPPSPPVLVDSPKRYQQMLDHLRSQPVIALDTESDGFFRYYSRVCLIQISAHTTTPDHSLDGDGPIIDYLVDSLALTALDELGEVLADPSYEIILHAADNDLLLLQRDFDLCMTNIFDTQLAARILGWKPVGLAGILKACFGIRSNKRMQRTNWGQRPLSSQQLHYAQMDSHYLFPLRSILGQELARLGRVQEAQEAFERLEEIDFRSRPPGSRTFWDVKNARELPAQRMNVFQALWEWREAEAQRRNRPAFKIAGDQVLIDIAQNHQNGHINLCQISGTGSILRHRYGERLQRLVHHSAQLPPPIRPQPTPKQRPPPEVVARFEALRLWRKRKAKERGVDLDIILRNELLFQIAKHRPHTVEKLAEIPRIGLWKASEYGPAILAVLQQCDRQMPK